MSNEKLWTISNDNEEATDNDNPDQQHGQDMEKVFAIAVVIFQNGSVINAVHSMVFVSMKSA